MKETFNHKKVEKWRWINEQKQSLSQRRMGVYTGMRRKVQFGTDEVDPK